MVCWIFSYVILWQFQFHTLYLLCDLFCINFCKRAKGLCLDLFSACDCPVVLASFFEKKNYLCSIVFALLLCKRSVDYIYVGLCSIVLFLFSYQNGTVLIRVTAQSTSLFFIIVLFWVFCLSMLIQSQFVNIFKITYKDFYWDFIESISWEELIP